MKSIFVLIISIILFSCQTEVIEDFSISENSIDQDSLILPVALEDIVDSISNKVSKSSNGMISILKSATSNDEYSDWSGQVHIKVFSGTTAPQAQQYDNWYGNVSDDYVCIGGGAWTGATDAGAFLVDSRPKTDFSGWLVSSKDHLESDPHYLNIFAIGLKIDGVSKADLKSRLKIFTNTSSEAHHPSTYVYIPSGYNLIGGGADITYDGYGCLLVHSYPDFFAGRWCVKGKDHEKSDPSVITAYAIGIEKGAIPGFGELEFSCSYNNSYVSAYADNIVNLTTSGWVLSCPGGLATFSDEGRMITSLSPYNNQSGVGTKDHHGKDSGYTYAFSIMIRKKI